MLRRGLLFLKTLDEARGKIVKLASQFITNGAVSICADKTSEHKTSFLILNIE